MIYKARKNLRDLNKYEYLILTFSKNELTHLYLVENTPTILPISCNVISLYWLSLK